MDLDEWLVLNEIYQRIDYSHDVDVLYHIKTLHLIEVVDFGGLLERAGTGTAEVAG